MPSNILNPLSFGPVLSHTASRYDVDDDLPQEYRESSLLTGLHSVRNSTQLLSAQENAKVRRTDGFFTRVWHSLRTPDGSHAAGTVSDEEGTELTEILAEGKVLRRRSESLSAPVDEEPAPGVWKGSLLKRGLVGAGILTGGGLLGRSGYQYYAGRPASTTDPVKNNTRPAPSVRPGAPQPGSGGMLEDSFGSYSLQHHDDRRNNIRHAVRHLPERVPVSATLQPEPTAGRIKSHKGGGTKPRLSHAKKKSHKRLVRMLQKVGFLDKSGKKGPFTRTEKAAAIAHMIYGQDHRIPFSVSERDQRLIMAARYILRAENLYGGRAGEGLMPEQAWEVICHWFFEDMLHMSAEHYLAGQVATLLEPDKVTAGGLDALLRNVPEHMSKDLQSLSEGRRLLFLQFRDDVFSNTLPFRHWPLTDAMQSLSVNDDAFVWRHAGALWLADAGADLRNISAEESQVVGKALWDMAESGNVPVSNLKYLRLPALLFQAVRSPEKVWSDNTQDYQYILESVNDYAEYRRTTRALYDDFRAKVEAFSNKIAAWTSRGNITDGYVSQCPQQMLTGMGREHPPVNMVPGTYPRARSRDEKLKDGMLLVRQAYLDGRVSGGCPPADVTAEFTLKTRQAADAFTAVDEYFIAMALGELPESERDFINNGNAVMRKMSSQITAYIGRGVNYTDKVKKLKNTDLFAVTVGTEERIYAFVAEGKGGYKVERPDRDTEQYILHDLFGMRDKNIVVTKDDRIKPLRVRPWGQLSYHQSFSFSGSAITGSDTSLVNLVQYVKEKHHKEFYDQMYAAGYTASMKENAWNLFKHFIPFYDCATEKWPDNLSSCLVDTLTFIPLVGEAASLGGKFCVSLARGASAGMRVAKIDIYAAKTITGQFVKQISLPTLGEIASLGKNALRTLDPGVELLGCVSKFSYRGVRWVEKQVRSGKNAADIMTMERLLKKIPAVNDVKTVQPLSPVSSEMAYLPNLEIKVPVTRVGKKDGQDIYVMVRPETGELFGRRYLLKEDRLQTLLKTTLKRRHKHPKSVHLSENLKNLISPDMISETVDAGKLSASDHMGLRHDADGNKYIVYKGDCFRTEQNGNIFSMKKKNGDILYITFSDGKFSPLKINNLDSSLLPCTGYAKRGIDSVCSYTMFVEGSNGDMLRIRTEGNSDAEFLLYPEYYNINLKSVDVDATQFEKTVSELTSEERKAIREWTHVEGMKGIYSNAELSVREEINFSLNQALIKGKPLTNRQKANYDGLISAMTSGKLPEYNGEFLRGVVYDESTQGIRSPWADGTIKVNDIVTNGRPFMSVTDRQEFITKFIDDARHGGLYSFTTYKIENGKPTPFLADALSLIRDESEWLFKPDTYFRVKGISSSTPQKMESGIFPRDGVILEQIDKKNIQEGSLVRNLFTGNIDIEYRNNKIHLESHRQHLARIKYQGLSGRMTRPDQMIANRLKVSEVKAKEILSKYEFPEGSQLYTEGTFAMSVRDTGKFPEWSKSFKKIEANDYVSPYRGSKVMDNGLHGFYGKSNYFYRVDNTPPETVLKNGFKASEDYTAISKMLPEDMDGVIVAESLEGARRYQTINKNSHIYRIDGKNVEGVSLKDNLYTNEKGLNDFLGEPLAKKHSTLESLAEDTNGAIYLDEVHLRKETIRPSAISIVHPNEISGDLSPGPWKKYL